MTDKFLHFLKKVMIYLRLMLIICFRLKEGDKWCLCVLRWVEALNANCAPKVELESTMKKY